MTATLQPRWWTAPALALAAALSGCLASGPDDLACPETTTWGRVDTIEGSDVRVVLMDGSPAVLHTADSEFLYVVADTECYDAYPENLRPGQEIEFDADRWAESYPPQAWPDHIVIRG